MQRVSSRAPRHTFVSTMSPGGVPAEEIARWPTKQTRTTESVYRRELRPVITIGAEIRDQIFPS